MMQQQFPSSYAVTSSFAPFEVTSSQLPAQIDVLPLPASSEWMGNNAPVSAHAASPTVTTKAEGKHVFDFRNCR
eukprot:CAMPEP_0181334530 /NCGR_PEP_ID=MMETSP1101-20121128/26315_1 /TAXON_ID=46948 /ORGANISM="Rhodomonas abbreviata, Strain Caron Lab Isolate" /LENGTH=73 /DNA_ID=CAMNT_0023444525 /DNA_START=99 /DNA_END=317 /DNA_ORIENTATION=-